MQRFPRALDDDQAVRCGIRDSNGRRAKVLATQAGEEAEVSQERRET